MYASLYHIHEVEGGAEQKGRHLKLLGGGGLAISIADLHIVGFLGRSGLPKLLPQQIEVGLDVQVALTTSGGVAIELNTLGIHLQGSIS